MKLDLLILGVPFYNKSKKMQMNLSQMKIFDYTMH